MSNNEINTTFFQKLIKRYLKGKTTTDELKLLVNYYESFQKENEWVETLGSENIIKDRMLINILEVIKKEDKSTKTKVIHLFKSKIVKYGIAASICFFMVSYYFINNADRKQNLIQKNTIVNTSIKAGTNKAILTKDDGSNITLEKDKPLTTAHAVSNGKEIVYSKEKNTNKEIIYNYLTIPRGGQFFLKLADGTQVWLNSETKIKYPVSFTKGKPRVIELLYGEAYFSVSPSTQNNGSAFIVSNNNHKIEVLGTEFNIKAYADEPTTTTTLVHGKVNILYKGEKYVLLPSQQSNLEKMTNTISFKQVDVFHEISWKNNVFSFNNKSLKDIMLVLSRWYDFNVTFKNKTVENEEFVGVLGRNEQIEKILLNLKTLELITNYEITEKNILIE